MEAGFIYGLVDPRDGALWYVGQTIKPLSERLRGHLNEHTKSHKCQWISELRRRGQIPKIVTLAVCAISELDAKEVFFVSLAKACGCSLLNRTAGGKDMPRWLLERRERISRKAMRRRRLRRAKSLWRDYEWDAEMMNQIEGGRFWTAEKMRRKARINRREVLAELTTT